ncbi:MAG: hypothetical protein HXS46_09560 [Theionarchaea archaeon]|nr:hypothetical protein [Theionarchaea archaeon]
MILKKLTNLYLKVAQWEMKMSSFFCIHPANAARLQQLENNMSPTPAKR